jgi:ABC-type bacteriocin/lantibiotic exporter with double-glycine peptidase domain
MKIKYFPNLRQTYGYDCGAQVLQAVLAYYGIDINEGEIMKLAGTTKQGTSVAKIKEVAKKHGLKIDFKEMNIEDVKKYIDKKIPVILLLQAWTSKSNADWKNDWQDGHYAIAIGYDKKGIYFEDPSSIFRTFLSYNELKDRWHDKDNKIKYVNYGMAIYGKKPA